MRFEATDRWRARWPSAVVACMQVQGVSNPELSPELDAWLFAMEQQLRERYAGFDRATLRASPPFAAYERYYKEFGQTYHVWRQVESVALKGTAIPRRAALVEAAFAEELASGLLTALHDSDVIGESIVTDIATGDEVVVAYNGQEFRLDADDMYMRNDIGVLTSIVKGPTAYGRVTSETTNVTVCVYAPAGIGSDAVARHLAAIAENMRLVSPAAEVVASEIISAPGSV